MSLLPFERCPGISATSIDGRLRLTQTTTQEPPRSRRSEMKVWSLVEVSTGRALWTREEISAPPCARGVHLHVDGSAAVHLDDDSLVLLDPRGSATLPIRVLEALRCADPRTDQLTDPRLSRKVPEPCDSRPKAFFLEDAGRVFFAFRVWWGATLLFDVRTGAMEPVGPERRLLLRAAAEAWALARLAEAARGRDALEVRPHHHLRETCAAAQLAGQLSLERAAPLLEQIETLPPGVFQRCARLVSAEASAPGSPFRTAPPHGAPRSVRVFPRTADPLRLEAQLALLRLGRAPLGYAGYAFPSTGETPVGVEPEPRSPDWIDAISSIRPGMPPSEVLLRIGAPSHIPSRYGAGADDPWDYEHRHIDGSPRALRIRWKGDVVRDVELLTEPAWPRIGWRDAPY